MAAKKMTATLARAQTEDIKHKFLTADKAITDLRVVILDFDERKGPEAMGFDNFTKWAEKCLPWTKSRCFKLLKEGKIERRITGSMSPVEEEIPSQHLLEIGKVDEDKQAHTYQQSIDLANEGNEGETVMPKMKHIKAAIKKLQDRMANAPAPAPTTDGRGTPVSNDSMAEVMEGATGFDGVMSVLARLKTTLTELAHTPAGEMLAQELSNIEAARTRMYQLVRFSRPFAECVYCRATGKSNGKTCRGCKGRRWLNESAMKQAPKETQSATTTVPT